MNNKISKYVSLCAMSLAFSLTSCDNFLDKLPDDRAEVNSVEKVQKLLTTAYPNKTIAVLTEYSSDNVADNGAQFKTGDNQEEMYRFNQVTTTSNDDPKSVWEAHYMAIATANAALDGISALGENEQTLPLKAEALLCRAYSVFCLANCFCMAYDPTKANEYLGIPYPTQSGISVDSRGTLENTYAMINADIEAALPLLDDSYLKVPAYHFNKRAAYAFAARFNLYYQKWDKAVEYATVALGTNPISNMRTGLAGYKSLGNYSNHSNAYIASTEAANFLLVTKYSIMGRMMVDDRYTRFAHNRTITTRETFWAETPWNAGYNSSDNTLYESHMLYGSDQTVFTGSVFEYFEVKDKVNQTGYPHIVEMAFTGDETALVRAEANINLGNYNEALIDLNNYLLVHCSATYGTKKRPTLTVENINSFWNNVKYCAVTPTKEDGTDRTPKKELHPQGFTLRDETHINMLTTVLQLRRYETFRNGLRFQDIKRYGIEFTHNLDGEKDLVFKAGDLRGAIMLPTDVIEAGLEQNPR